MVFGDWMSGDGKLVLVEKSVRTIPYGFLGILYSVYLPSLGFDAPQIGIVLTLTIFTSAFYTFIVSFLADRFGRRRTLIFFALMDFLAGSILFSSAAWWAPVIAGIVGNMTVGSGEVGPFLSIEQAILPKTCDSKHRTLAFSVYNLIGYGSTSVGALLSGLPQYFGSDLYAYRPLFAAYLASGLVGSLLYARLSGGIEVRADQQQRAQVLSQKSKPIVRKLASLFALDSFGGGFIAQTIISYYFYTRFDLQLSSLGLIFAAASFVTAFSFLAAERIARRIGLLRTMVLSHFPSNIFLASIAFAPSASLAVALLLCRSSLSQMDVPTRQSYVMAVVDESDRTAAAGFTNVSRTVAQSVSPSLAGYAIAILGLGAPFIAAGSFKIAYDLLIYASFRRIKPPEESAGKT